MTGEESGATTESFARASVETVSVGVDGLGDSIAPEETTSDEETDSCVVNGAGANVILELLLFTSKLE